MRVFALLAAGALMAGMPAARLGEGALSLELESAAEAQTFERQPERVSAYLPRLRAEAERAGISRATLDRVFPTLTFSPRTVELDRAQPGGPPGSQRQSALRALSRPPSHPGPDQPRPRPLRGEPRRGSTRSAAATASRLDAGRDLGQGDQLRHRSSAISTCSTRSPASLMRAAAAQLFTDEFVATLKMMERGFPRAQLQGQLGRRDRPSAIPAQRLYPPRASTATATAAPTSGAAISTRSPRSPIICATPAGGRACPGATAVRVPAGFDRAAVANRLRAPRCPRGHRPPQPLADRGANGAAAASPTACPTTRSPRCSSRTGRAATAYLLTTNYRMILDYNCSNFYALTVGLLADSVSR